MRRTVEEEQILRSCTRRLVLRKTAGQQNRAHTETDGCFRALFVEPPGGAYRGGAEGDLTAREKESFKATLNFWHHWIGRSNYSGRWREMVHRSALVLKLVISRTHGSLIAAPTFSLPESIGGVRNWDYRFTWLRDATFTLYALIRLGFVDETEAFIDEKRKEHGEVNLISSGSSLKLCLVAEGKAQVYPRLAPTMEWDTAAGHAVAKFAGCTVYNYETKKEVVYNKENLLNPWFVVERVQ